MGKPAPSPSSAANPIAGLLGGGLGAILGGALTGGAPSLPGSGQVQAGATQLSNEGSNVAATGQNLLTTGESLTPHELQQYQTYIQSLNTNPFTSTFDTAQTANANAQAARNLSSSNAQLTSELSARGLAQPGGASSPLAGGIVANTQTATNAQDTAANQLAARAMQQWLEQQGMAANAAGQEQQQFIGQGYQGEQTGAGIQNMSQQDLLQYMQNYLQAQQQQSQASSGLGSGLGSLITGALSLPGVL